MNQFFRTPIGTPPERQEKFPEDEPFDDGPLEAAKVDAMKALLLMFALTVFISAYFIWLHWQTTEVEASRPIGQLLGMSGPGARQWPLVIETEQGFFPLGDAVAIPKGTPLMLEERASGKRFICDLKRTVCVQTSFESMPAPQPPASKGGDIRRRGADRVEPTE